MDILQQLLNIIAAGLESGVPPAELLRRVKQAQHEVDRLAMERRAIRNALASAGWYEDPPRGVQQITAALTTLRVTRRRDAADLDDVAGRLERIASYAELCDQRPVIMAGIETARAGCYDTGSAR